MTAPFFRCLALVLPLVAGTVASAQDESAFVKPFSGEWFIFDPQFGAGDATCAIDLSEDLPETASRRDASANNCAQPLSNLASWDINAGQLRLFAKESETPLAILGGNQNRITGALADTEQGLIVERAGGDISTRAIAQAVARHHCIFRGFSSDCSASGDLGKPSMTEEDGAYGSVGILVNLNVRDEPRNDAPVVGTIPAESCLKVNYCVSASDSIWCRARFGDRAGWIRKIALRQEEWPILTYSNTCPATD